MHQRRAHQPRHEGRVLHRVPEPPATPAQFVIRPPTAEHDADGQKAPRQRRPWPRPARPCGVELATDQRSDGKRECHREADITHIEHRRMDHHTRVLQQRVQITAFSRRRQQTLERIRGQQQKQKKADADQAQHADHTSHHGGRQVAAKDGDTDGPNVKHQHP